jgi:hypothetical protein
MSGEQLEVIRFADLEIPIRRQPIQETYLALEPPEAQPYVVVPLDAAPADVVVFVEQRVESLRELRDDMLKHFSKTKSLKCRFRTGDVAYLLGRPFMLRSNPLSTVRKNVKGARGRANVQAVMYPDLSVIDLHVMQAGNYDQGRAAFFSYAKVVFAQNVTSLLQQCMQRVFPEATAPSKVNCRPLRDAWVRFDPEHDTVWFSESLIPYPVHAVVYAYLVEAIKRFAPEATEAERLELLDKGVFNWQQMKEILADSQSRYAL